MPAENEIPYILDFDITPARLESAGWKKVPIRQGYLDNGPRIRDYDGSRIFTYKRWIAEKNRDTEIETTLNEEDFNDLWNECSAFIAKDRYYCPDNTDTIEWAVDFVKDKQGNVIMIRAEVEMREDGMETPPFIPDLIEPHIFYEIPKGSFEFSNMNMAKGGTAHIRQLLQKIGLEAPLDKSGPEM